jgi:hypothetical protein
MDMGDIIDFRARHASQWKQLYEAAMLEHEPAKVLQRIDLAERAIVDQMEEAFSKISHRQQLALCDALHMLSTLREIEERDIGGPRNTGHRKLASKGRSDTVPQPGRHVWTVT